MTMKERKAKAEAEFKRVNAIMKVYELIEDGYHNAFCEIEIDEEGNYKTDEDGNYIYKEAFHLNSFRFDYDEEFYDTCREVMKEVLDKVANMK